LRGFGYFRALIKHIKAREWSDDISGLYDIALDKHCHGKIN